MEQTAQITKPPAGPGHREACQECHSRKIRCITESGACQNCIFWGKSCTYSPRVPMGRPRKRKTNSTSTTKSATAKSSTNHSSSKSKSASSRTGPPAEVVLSQPPPFGDGFSFDDALPTMEHERASSASSTCLSLDSYAMNFLPTPMTDHSLITPMTDNADSFFGAYDPNCYLQYSEFTNMAVDEPDSLMLAPRSRSKSNGQATIYPPNGGPRTPAFGSSYTQAAASHQTPTQLAPPNTPEDSSDGKITVLPTMLFEIRRLRDDLESCKDAASLSAIWPCFPNEIFGAITNFCDVAQACLNTPTGSKNSQSMVYLILMILSGTFEIFHMLSRDKAQMLYSHSLSAATAGMAAMANMTGAEGLLSTAAGVPPQQLSLILNLTTMDYLLVRCGRTLAQMQKITSAVPDDTEAGTQEEIKRGQAEVGGLREELKGLVEIYKMPCGFGDD